MQIDALNIQGEKNNDSSIPFVELMKSMIRIHCIHLKAASQISCFKRYKSFPVVFEHQSK